MPPTKDERQKIVELTRLVGRSLMEGFQKSGYFPLDPISFQGLVGGISNVLGAILQENLDWTDDQRADFIKRHATMIYHELNPNANIHPFDDNGLVV